MIAGVSINPMFCIQNMIEYADPRTLLSTNFGTLGHNAAGTNENDTPNITMAVIAMP